MQTRKTSLMVAVVGLLTTFVAFASPDERIVTVPFSNEEEPFSFMVILGPSDGEFVWAPATVRVDPQGRYIYVLSMGSGQTISLDVKKRKLLADFTFPPISSVDTNGNLWSVGFRIDQKNEQSVEGNIFHIRSYDEITFHLYVATPFGHKKTHEELGQEYEWIKEIRLDGRDMGYRLMYFVDLAKLGGRHYLLYSAVDENGNSMIIDMKERDAVLNLGKNIVGFDNVFVRGELLYFWKTGECKTEKRSRITQKQYLGAQLRETTISSYGGRRIEVYSLRERKRVREYTLPASGQLSADETRVGESSAPIRLDGRGHHYVEVIPDRSEWKLLQTNFGDMYVSPRLILEYDHAGRFVGVRCQVYCPHFMGLEGPKSYWDVDAEGNIYYLKWTNKGVEVWKSPVQKRASQPK